MDLTLAHSPDADDAFMFWALATGQLDSAPYHFEHILQDIQTLNQRVLRSELDISAISIHSYPKVADHYILLDTGASFGDGYGPVLISLKPHDKEWLKGKTVAIPGPETTAALALQLFEPDVKMLSVPFNQIMATLREGKADAGVIIHEGQLTYAEEGMHALVDLGTWWQEKTGGPLPLGGNVIRRTLGEPHISKIAHILKQSIQMGLESRSEALEYALSFGRGLDPQKADRFISMYVNHWTVDYGPEGRAAVQRLLDEGAKAGLIPPTQAEFVLPKDS